MPFDTSQLGFAWPNTIPIIYSLQIPQIVDFIGYQTPSRSSRGEGPPRPPADGTAPGRLADSDSPKDPQDGLLIE